MSTLPNAGRPDIAIVGMAAVLPGAGDLDAFWNLLREGREAITHGSPRVVEDDGSGRRWVHARGVVEGMKDFDADFFGIPKREAEVLDPQHRHLLQCAWNAMEDAGYDPYRVAEDVAVYSSVGPNTYYQGRDFGPRSAAERMLIQLSNSPDTLSTRLSYKLGLTGESVNVQSACSSAAVAVHLACEALREGRSGTALVGAVSIGTADTVAYEHQEGFILSADGSTRAYDSKGSGYVEGDGVGVLVLRRLEDAQRDGDHIHAVIKGSAVNNDGRAKAGFSAPSVEGQSRVIRAALEASGVPAESIGLLEGHGTGTLVGDPIEVRALARAYEPYTSKTGYAALGSVKANIGHLCFASGIAGLLKAVLCLKHGEIPPMAVLDEINPDIDLDPTPFYLNRELRPWQAEVRRAGVSCFGMGGTNAHFVLEQAPEPEPFAEAAASEGPYAVLLSGRTEEALGQVKERLREFLAAYPDTGLADLVYTLASGRRPLAYRWAAEVSSVAETKHALCGDGTGLGEGADGRDGTVAAIAREWAAGGTPDWAAQFQGRQPRRISLPTYPWQGEQLWIEPEVPANGSEGLLEAEEQAPLADWLYRPLWQRTALPRPYHRGDLPGTDGVALVFGDRRPLTESLLEEFVAAGLTCVLVEPGVEFEVDRERHRARVRPAEAEDAFRLVEWAAELGPVRKVVHLSSYGGDVTGQQEAVRVGALSMLTLVQALDGAVQAPEVWVVTENAQPAQGEATSLDVEAAALLGLCRVIGQEYGAMSCRCVDFSAGSPPSDVVARLLAEMATPQEELEVLYRGPDRMTMTVEPVRADPGRAVPLQRNGVYLITGGLGRIGLTIAERFARSTPVRLALLSRRGMEPADDSERGQTVQALRELGAEVSTFAADVADQRQLERVIKQVTEEWGPVNGVVHAAGIEEGRNFSLLSETTTERAVEAMRPKVPGIAVLDRATRAQPLDFCLVCSSLDTLLGGIAFGVYTAANRYLDTYAHWRRAHGAPWVSVDWDSWRFDEAGGARIGAAAARTAIRREQGGELLGSVLALGEAQCMVSTVALDRRIDRVRRTFAHQGGTGDSGAAVHTTKEDVSSTVLRIVAEVAEAAETAPEDELLAIGCDSLALLEVVSRIEQTLGVSVPLGEFWGCTTVGELIEVGWSSVPSPPEEEADAGREALQYLAG